MPKCEWCGKEFDRSEAEYVFTSEYTRLNYDFIQPCLCGECAIGAVRDEASCIYFEYCEKCGKRFDLADEKMQFASNFPWYNGTTLEDHWNPLIVCSECAIKEIEKN